jgi:hypothetical protein
MVLGCARSVSPWGIPCSWWQTSIGMMISTAAHPWRAGLPLPKTGLTARCSSQWPTWTIKTWAPITVLREDSDIPSGVTCTWTEAGPQLCCHLCASGMCGGQVPCHVSIWGFLSNSGPHSLIYLLLL